MPLEVIHEAPRPESFTPLAVHQSQTPNSFFAGNPVLYHHITGAQAIIEDGQTELRDIFLRDTLATADRAINGHSTSEDAPTNGTGHGQRTLSGVDVFVTSERFILFQPSNLIGLSITYPSISLHAIQRLSHSNSSDVTGSRQGLYMQIENGAESYGEDEATIELTVIPTSTPGAVEGQSIQDLYAAVSSCSNLHPDHATGSDGQEDGSGGEDDRIMFEGNVGYESNMILPGNQDGSLPPPFPGSGGWITAENVGEYFDEEGNWRAGLGPGAGTVRERDEERDEEPAGADHATDHREAGDHDETKWRRTE